MSRRTGMCESDHALILLPCGDVNLAVAHINLERTQFLAGTGPPETQATLDFVHRAMRGTNDGRLILGQKSIRLPVQRVPDVHADILVSVNFFALAYDETT